MKKIIIFIFVLWIHGFSQNQSQQIVNEMQGVFDVLSTNMERAMSYTFVPLSLSSQTNPMPQYSLLKEKGVYSFSVGLLWNTLLPSLSSDAWKKDFKSDYRSPVKSIFSNDNSFLSYNFGAQFFFRDNRPVFRRFIYRLEYDGMYTSNNSHALIGVSPVLSGIFTGDEITVGLSFTKIDAGVDFVALESRYLDLTLGLGYTFANANLDVNGIVNETLSDINPNPDIQSTYKFTYKMITQYISLPITFNAKLYKDVITAYLGYNFSINVVNKNSVEMSMNFKTGIPVPLEERYTKQSSVSPDIFHGRLYAGFNIYMFGIQFYYIHEPSIVGLSLNVNTTF